MPDGLLQALLFVDTAVLHLGLALVMGALACQVWLRSGVSAWASRVLQQSQIAQQAGSAITLIASAGGLWLQAALMGDVPLMAAGGSLMMVLRDTHFGHVWLFGLAAWVLVTVSAWLPAASRPSVRGLVVTGVGVAGFALGRSLVSHAASNGDLSLAVGMDWVHLLLVCLWVGVVLAGVSIDMPKAGALSDRADATRWVSSLSSTATGALVLIVLTGLFKTWKSTPTLEALVASDYGQILAVKLALVAFAMALGGVNRFFILPAVITDLKSSDSPGKAWGRLIGILRAEAIVLSLVLIAAAVLSGSQPPIDG